MPSSIIDYRNLVDKPYGKIFYDIVFSQLDFLKNKHFKIFDFGAGFCITANHYAADHDITVFEPNTDMLSLRINENAFKIVDNIDTVKNFPDKIFDVIICHNVLEYLDNKSETIAELVRLLKTGGILSIIKHNLSGRIIASAVFDDLPSEALKILSNDAEQFSMFGSRMCYSNDWLISELKSMGLTHTETYGIRAFYALSSNNAAKYSKEWFKNMLELEIKCAKIEDFQKIAFFNHLIFSKL